MKADVRDQALQGVDVPAAVFTDRYAFIEAVRTGISGSIVRQAIAAMNNSAVFIKILDTDPSKIARFYRRKRLGKADSEAVLDTLRLYWQAVALFGDDNIAQEWLKTPLPALSGRAPAELLDTFEGRFLVRDTLTRIDQGEFT